MRLFDMFKSNARSSITDEVSSIMVTIDVGGTKLLFILLAQDGTINRMGTGTANNTDNDMFIGMSDGAAFTRVRELAGPIIDNWIGSYGVPDPRGKSCELLVGLRTSDGRELMSHWKYGSESQGPPPELASIARKAVEETDNWWQEQKATAAGRA